MATLILVIDGEQQSSDLLRRSLSRAGFLVQCTGSGEDGLRLAREVLPELIVLELLLPDMDGYEVIRRCRSDPDLVDVPIIVLTGRRTVADCVVALDLGADDYLMKPFSPLELIARAQAVLRRRHPAHSLLRPAD